MTISGAEGSDHFYVRSFHIDTSTCRTLLAGQGDQSLALLFVIVRSFPDDPSRDPGVSLVDARFSARALGSSSAVKRAK